MIQKVTIACGSLQFIKRNGKSNELLYNYNGESIKRIRFTTGKYKKSYYVKSSCGIHYRELDIIIFKNKYTITVRTRFSIIIRAEGLIPRRSRRGMLIASATYNALLTVLLSCRQFTRKASRKRMGYDLSSALFCHSFFTMQQVFGKKT